MTSTTGTGHDDDFDDDVRSAELETLEAIFPEIHYPIKGDRFTFELEIPVVPIEPVTVTFPPPSGVDAGAGAVDLAGLPVIGGLVQDDVSQLSYLPPLLVRIQLPAGYPEECAPVVGISTQPSWLASQTLSQLENDAPRLWEEAGRDMMAFTYIDHIQREAEDIFHTTTDDGALMIDAQHKLAVLDYDIKAKKTAFERETFECSICLDPKKGSKCHKMLDCGHIFCLDCLQSFYNDAIQEGSLQTVRCLSPNCAKERSAEAGRLQSGPRAKKAKVYISPSELLQIGLSEETVKRYVALKYKTELETDKNTIYCPRPSCNGAARSERHKKPKGFELHDISDEESENGGDGTSEDGNVAAPGRTQRSYDPGDRLAICEDCSFAFCQRCYQSWHGEFVYCVPKIENGDITAEEKASIEYMKLHTSPCPTCNAPAQKTHGCNHMICSRCESHFCYLCSAWLDPTNPYRHYNLQTDGKATSCYMRLWELEEGDGDDVGLGFVGGVIRRVEEPQAQPPPARPEGPAQNGPQVVRELEDQVNEDEPNDEQRPQAPAVALEAPLVLRIMDQRPRPQAPAPAPEPQVAAGRGQGQRGRGRGRVRGGRQQQAANRGARGAGGAARAANPVANPPAPQPVVVQHVAADFGDPANIDLDLDMGLDLDLDGENGVELDAAQEAWIRTFVQMALIDAEDELDGDSGDDEFLIR